MKKIDWVYLLLPFLTVILLILRITYYQGSTYAVDGFQPEELMVFTVFPAALLFGGLVFLITPLLIVYIRTRGLSLRTIKRRHLLAYSFVVTLGGSLLLDYEYTRHISNALPIDFGLAIAEMGLPSGETPSMSLIESFANLPLLMQGIFPASILCLAGALLSSVLVKPIYVRVYGQS